MKMNLLVTLDSNYIPPLTVMLKSIMMSNPDNSFELYVAHSSLTEADLDAIRANCDMTRTNVHPIRLSDETFRNAPVLKRISKETYFRLLLTDYLPEEVDRILYIDPDTVVINPLDSLYNINFQDNIIAGAGHTKGFVEFLNRRRLHMAKDAQYINAGVMMVNVELMRKTVTTDEIFSFISANLKKLYLADQDVINAMFWRKIIRIDPLLYNLDEKTVHNAHGSINNDWIRLNTVIVHFNGSEKPWKDSYKGVLDSFYYYYKNAKPASSASKAKILSFVRPA